MILIDDELLIVLLKIVLSLFFQVVISSIRGPVNFECLILVPGFLSRLRFFVQDRSEIR